MIRGAGIGSTGRVGATVQVIGIDVYGTLVDPADVAGRARELVGDAADRLVADWRARQLEFVFRRSAMGTYIPFDRLTADALDHTTRMHGIALTDADRRHLNGAWTDLPAYPDAVDALASLAGAGHRLFALSNATRADLESLLAANGLRDALDGVLSVDDIGVYKPAPAVYRYLLAEGGTVAEATWLVSGNAWDVIGARSAGLRGAWVRRTPLPLESWEQSPDRIVDGLGELAADLPGELPGTSEFDGRDA